MEIALIIALTLLVVAAAAWLLRRSGDTDPPRRPGRWAEPEADATVVLDLEVVDTGSPALARLVHDAADRVLAARADLDHVEVQDRAGRSLGIRTRERSPLREVALPDSLSEPHARRRHGPTPVSTPDDRPRPGPPEAGPIEVPRRSLAARFDLPDVVVGGITDPGRPIEVVRAILAAGGRPAATHGDRLISDDTAVVVVDVRDGAETALTHAFLRIQDSGASRGLVLTLGYVDPEVIRRREAAAAHVRYVGADAIQRMADAVELGIDPLDVAVAPPVLRTR